MVCLSVLYRFPPERVAEVLAMLAPMIEESRREPGCLLYAVHQSTSDPATLLFYERYHDEAALDAHRAAPYFVRIMREGVQPLALSREADLYRLIG